MPRRSNGKPQSDPNMPKVKVLSHRQRSEAKQSEANRASCKYVIENDGQSLKGFTPRESEAKRLERFASVPLGIMLTYLFRSNR